VVVGADSKVGDRGVYFEIDSVLPSDATWADEALRGKIIKTRKIRGVLSQGLFLNGRELHEKLAKEAKDKFLWECADVTDLLGVTKADDQQDPETTQESKLGRFCDGLAHPPPKTEEARLQNEKRMLCELQGKPYVITEKIDGCSATFFYNPDGVPCVASRNYTLLKRDKSTERFFAIAEKYDLARKLAPLRHLVLQGEIYGPGVQKNPLGQTELKLAVFSVWNTIEQRYLDFAEQRSLLLSLDLPSVPLVELGVSFNYDAAQLLEKARGTYAGTKNHREGLVVRPQKEIKTGVAMKRLSFKVINNDYLLAQK
jgi:RNA ligase (TIGR02306 family)